MEVDNVPTPAVHEYPLKFLITIAPLKDLAATRLALDLWYQNNLGKYNLSNYNCGRVLRETLPLCITQIINGHIYSIVPDLDSLYKIFVGVGICQDNYTFLKYFDALTVGHDGKICPERTAKNLLTRNDLIQWQKFQIACVFWLEDEIRKIWPTVSDHPDPNIREVFEPFVRYWEVKMRNCGVVSISDAQYSELEKMLSTSRNFDNWFAFANIFNILRAEQQFASIRDFTRSNRYSIKDMLSKSNRVQVEYILSNFPNEIISGLALSLGNFENAIRIWNLVQESIETKKFFEIFESLWIDTYDMIEYNHPDFIRTQAHAIILKIWISALHRSKMEFFNDEKYVIMLFESLPEINRLVRHGSDDDMTFISKLFSDMPMKLRSRIWLRYWRQIIICSPAKMLDSLLDLGFKYDDSRDFVEREMMNFTKAKPVVEYLMKQHVFDEVISYTKLCSWNDRLVREFRTKIFSECIPSSYFFNFDDLIKIGVEIDKSLPNVEAKEAKRMILFSNNVQVLFRCRLNRGWAKEAINMMDSFLPTERSLHEKQSFLDHWCKFLSHNIYKFNSFDVERLREFLYWWVDNKDDLPIFKGFLSTEKGI